MSRFASASESDGEAVLNVESNDRNSRLNAAHPYAGSDEKSVLDGGYVDRNLRFISSRNANGMRRPCSAAATTM